MMIDCKNEYMIDCTIVIVIYLMAVCPLQSTSLVFVAVEGSEPLLQYHQLRGKTQTFHGGGGRWASD